MNLSEEETGHANHLWGIILADALYELGIHQVFFSPGSRSTPLVLALENHERIECTPILDERSAGFIALGFSKRTKSPTALLCTSGSALANWFPAVTEASHSGIPLFLLSADRPPELQNCGAGQTINQENLFGSFVRGFHQVPLPSLSLEKISKLQLLMGTAYGQALGTNPGPVHLNFPFREPLFMANLLKENSYPSFFKPSVGNQIEFDSAELLDSFTKNCKRPLLIAGEMAPPGPILSLIENYPIPVLCDSLSNLRNRSFPNGILRYENILRNSKLAKTLKPDLIITLGPLPTSKLLRTWLDHQGTKRVIIEPRGINVDPLASTSTSFQVNYSILPELSFEKLEDTWLDIWKNLEKSIEDKLDLHFEQDNEINEPKLIRLLSNHLPRNSQLHIANSMPMRDLEWFWRSGQVAATLFGNRGVNGIDGTLGTALGLAHQSKKPTFLLTGELAFLHDSNALLFSSFFKGSLTIILINNDGGGIFEHLPISQHEAFEKCFATPQSCSFQKLCEAHEIDYKIPSTWEEIIQEIESPFPSGIRLIEVMTDRKKNKKLRDNLLAISGAD